MFVAGPTWHIAVLYFFDHWVGAPKTSEGDHIDGRLARPKLVALTIHISMFDASCIIFKVLGLMFNNLADLFIQILFF